MKLSLWLYTHRYGSDILKVLHDDAYTPTREDVIRATQIDWEGEGSAEFMRDEREDEFLEHSDTLPLGDVVHPDMIAHLTRVWTPEYKCGDPRNGAPECQGDDA